MTKDYAKYNLSRRKTKKKSVYFGLWLLVLLLFVIFTIGLVYFGKQKQRFHVLAENTSKMVITSISQPETEIQKEIKPQFNFYTTASKVAERKVNAVEEYELNIAIVKKYTIADHLKAELALLGFMANITPTRQDGVRSYDVSVGPYDSKSKALADLRKLKQNKIKAKLKRI